MTSGYARAVPRPPFALSGVDASTPLVATAIHAGHDLRPEVEERTAVADAVRLREEDPHTDRIIEWAAPRAVVHRSRFEADLNRSREDAVYRTGDDAWGLELWTSPLPPGLIARSLEIYDAFYTELASVLDGLAAAGPFVVLDVHSYNHCRDGPGSSPAPQAGNPDVNLGTGSLDRERWAPTVDTFVAHLGAARVRSGPLDVRENVVFAGGHLARWINERYAGTGCALAVEFKKTFMDEWTGRVDERHLRELAHVLARTASAVVDVLAGMRR
jgi:N-formylglutamate amidohydrolase